MNGWWMVIGYHLAFPASGYFFWVSTLFHLNSTECKIITTHNIFLSIIAVMVSWFHSSDLFKQTGILGNAEILPAKSGWCLSPTIFPQGGQTFLFSVQILGSCGYDSYLETNRKRLLRFDTAFRCYTVSSV